tara:strand:+ start:261 stop:467 length:207 start_codon:yes stop_codon:yes gene_type:complete
MKNSAINLKEKLIAKYLEKDTKKPQPKSSDINVLLNRIELNKKNESRKKVLFSTAASAGLVIFGLIIF